MKSSLAQAVTFFSIVSAAAIPSSNKIDPTPKDITTVAGTTGPDHISIHFHAPCQGCFIGTDDGLELTLEIDSAEEECSSSPPRLNGLPLALTRDSNVAKGKISFKSRPSNGLAEKEVNASWESTCLKGEASIISVRFDDITGHNDVKQTSGFATSFKQKGQPAILRLQNQPVETVSQGLCDSWIRPKDHQRLSITPHAADQDNSIDYLIQLEYMKLDQLKGEIGDVRDKVHESQAKIMSLLKAEFKACSGSMKCLWQTAMDKVPQITKLIASHFSHQKPPSQGCKGGEAQKACSTAEDETVALVEIIPSPSPELSELSAEVDVEALPVPEVNPVEISEDTPPPQPETADSVEDLPTGVHPFPDGPPEDDHFPHHGAPHGPPPGFEGPAGEGHFPHHSPPHGLPPWFKGPPGEEGSFPPGPPPWFKGPPGEEGSFPPGPPPWFKGPPGEEGSFPPGPPPWFKGPPGNGPFHHGPPPWFKGPPGEEGSFPPGPPPWFKGPPGDGPFHHGPPPWFKGPPGPDGPFPHGSPPWFKGPPGSGPFHHGPPPWFKGPSPGHGGPGAFAFGPHGPHHGRPHDRLGLPHQYRHGQMSLELRFAFAVVALLTLVTLAAIAIRIIQLATRRFRDPRRRAECAARREERRTRRLYRKAACKHKFSRWWNRHRSQGTDDYEEKREIILEREGLLEDVMHDEIRTIRNATDLVRDLVRAEEGRVRTDRNVQPNGHAAFSPSELEAGAGSSRMSDTPPSYTAPPPRYEEEIEGEITVVDGFQYTPSNTDDTPESSIIDCNSRLSFETGRSGTTVVTKGSQS